MLVTPKESGAAFEVPLDHGSVVVFSLDIPFASAGVPWHSGWKWSSLNYSPLVLLVGVAVGIWWFVDARKKYTGPVR